MPSRKTAPSKTIKAPADRVNAKRPAAKVAPTAAQPAPKSVSRPAATSAPVLAKPPKQKQKLVRDSFAMPVADFNLIDALKERALTFRRPLRVFAVNAAHQVADFFEGLNRIAGSVQDHVGRVEVDEQIRATNIVNEFEQMIGRLLSRFEMQVLAVGRDVIEQPARRFEQPLIARSRSIGRDESDMQSDRSTTEQLGEVRDFFHLLDTRRAGRFGDEADRVRRGRNVGIALALKATEHARHCDSRPFAVREERVGSGLSARWLVGRVDLNGGNSQFTSHIQMNAQSGID